MYTFFGTPGTIRVILDPPECQMYLGINLTVIVNAVTSFL